jgi:hypothetical protein
MDRDDENWEYMRIKTGKAIRDYIRPFGLIRLDDLCDSGFNDEYDLCTRCGGLIRTSPDCYAWQADYWDQEMVCGDCIRSDPDLAEDYLDNHAVGNRKGETHLTGIVDPSDHDWVQLDDRYENGMHHGQNDDPRAIAKLLWQAEIDCLFSGSVGQFDVNFYTWVLSENEDQAREILSTGSVKLPYDPAEEYSKALSGKGSEYVKVRKITVDNGRISEETM